MILREIPRDYEAIKFTGDNAAEVEHFVRRHGGQIAFQTNDDGITSGVLHTLQGSENVVRNVYVVSDATDQVSRVHPALIENPEHARYTIVDEEAERLNIPAPEIPPEPEIEEEPEVINARGGAVIDAPVAAPSGMTPEKKAQLKELLKEQAAELAAQAAAL